MIRRGEKIYSVGGDTKILRLIRKDFTLQWDKEVH